MEPVTKWDLISEAERAALEVTPFGHPCTACDVHLATEADFAKHFLLYNRALLNVGYCPVAGQRGLEF